MPRSASFSGGFRRCFGLPRVNCPSTSCLDGGPFMTRARWFTLLTACCAQLLIVGCGGSSPESPPSDDDVGTDVSVDTSIADAGGDAVDTAATEAASDSF